MGRRWYDSTLGNMWIDNGTSQFFDVHLNGKHFRTVDPGDFLVKKIWGFFRKSNTLEIRESSNGRIVESCTFQYPFFGRQALIDSRESSLDYEMLDGVCHFVYNIRSIRDYRVLAVQYGIYEGDAVSIEKTITGKRSFFVVLDGVRPSIRDVPRSVTIESDLPSFTQVYLILRV